MTVIQAILQEIRESPDFAEYVEAMSDTLRREQAARRRFRASAKEDVRAEFINGRVVRHLPARLKHSTIVRHVGTLLDTSVRLKRLGAVHTEQSLCEFKRNDYSPDICFWRTAKSKHFTPDQLIYPVPDFICEVLSPSTAATDRSLKLKDYAMNGVGEYWIADPDREVLQQNLLEEDRYVLVGEFSEGIIRSKVVRGFKMPVRAAFDPKEYLVYLKQLMAR
jgi:Uma2 family endonuclease